MNGSMMRKAARDYAWLGAGAAILLAAFVIIFIFAVSSIGIEDRLDMMRVPWVRRLVSSMIGADIIENFTRTGMIAFAFAHPVAWAMLLGFTLTATTGLIAGEIDRGSFDFVATMPVSRWRIYVSYSLVVAAWVAVLCFAIWLGACVGLSAIGDTEADRGVLAIVAAHLFAACLFVAGMGLCVSAASSRRITAATICFVVVFYAFTLNVLEAFWPAIRLLGYTGFVHYYRPLPIARDGAFDWSDIGTLLGAGAVLWTIGLTWFVRRDLPGA